MKLKTLLMIGMVIVGCNQTHIIANTTKIISVSGVPTFDSSDLTVKAQITSEQLRNVLPKTMTELANDIVWYSELNGINSLFVASLIRQESGNNTSGLTTKNNNVGGIKINGKYHKFETKSKCIEYMTSLLKEQYLTDSGKFFNGYSVKSVSKLYNDGCEDWTKDIISMSNDMKNKIGGN